MAPDDESSIIETEAPGASPVRGQDLPGMHSELMGLCTEVIDAAQNFRAAGVLDFRKDHIKEACFHVHILRIERSVARA